MTEKKQPEAVKPQNTKVTAKEEKIQLVYIGPSLPAGKLMKNRIFIGTEKEIKDSLSEVLEKHPMIEKMLVPVKDLAEKKEKVRTQGNIYHKMYTDILSAIAAEGRE